MDDRPSTTGGEIPPAGVTGRVGKLLVGAGQLWFVYLITTRAPEIIDVPPRGPFFWVMVAWALWLVPEIVNIGLLRMRTSGRRSLWFLAAAIALAAFIDLPLGGAFWSPAAAFLLLAIAAVVHTYAGLSHLLAALIGLPGCELRVLAYLVAKARRDDASFVPCRGVWTPIDRWEARLISGRGSRSPR